MPEYTILIVDYDPRTLEALRGQFEALGHRVEMSTDGLDALTAFERVQPDLTLIEFMLPKKSGLEVCLELRGTPAGASTPILIMSSRFRSRQYRSEARHRYRADDFLEKPFDDERVAAIISRYLSDPGPDVAEQAGAESAPTEPIATELVVEASGGADPVAAQPGDEASTSGATDPALHDEITERIDALLGGDL